MKKAKNISIQVLIFILITIPIVFAIAGLNYLDEKNNPKYEQVPYTVIEERVYVTRYGDCYHSTDCSYLHSSKIAMGKNKARASGYYACSRCYGKPNGTIEVTYYNQVRIEAEYKITWAYVAHGALFGSVIFAIGKNIINKKKNYEDEE